MKKHKRLLVNYTIIHALLVLELNNTYVFLFLKRSLIAINVDAKYYKSTGSNGSSSTEDWLSWLAIPKNLAGQFTGLRKF